MTKVSATKPNFLSIFYLKHLEHSFELLAMTKMSVFQAVLFVLMTYHCGAFIRSHTQHFINHFQSLVFQNKTKPKKEALNRDQTLKKHLPTRTHLSVSGTSLQERADNCSPALEHNMLMSIAMSCAY